MNMEDWQRQQRSQKEAARKKKTESAQLLQGYKGGAVNEAEQKLKAFKEEERQKAQDAQQNLQGYKGGGAVSEADMKRKAFKAEERQKAQDAQQNLQGYKGGAVTEADLKMKALKEEERKRLQDAQQNLHNYKSTEIDIAKKEPASPRKSLADYPDAVKATTGPKDPKEGITAGSVSEKLSALSSAVVENGALPLPLQLDTNGVSASETSESTAAVADPTTANTENGDVEPQISQSAVEEVGTVDEEKVETTEKEMEQDEEARPAGSTKVVSKSAAPTSEQQVPANSEATAESTESTLKPSPDNADADKPAAALESNAVTDKEIEPETVVAAAATAEPSAVAVNAAAAAAEKPKKPILHRLDVLFSFGLVTVDPEQEMINYMAAVQNVVGNSLRKGLTFDPSNPPFVKDQKVDSTYKSKSGRKEVKRIVVTAAVPVLYEKIVYSKKDAKAIIVGALQSAIQSGEFLNMAQKKAPPE